MSPSEDDPVLLPLYEALRDAEPHRRYEAAILLGTPEISNIQPRIEIAQRLLPLLDDPHDHVRYYASVSLGKLGFVMALEPLVRRLDVERRSPSPMVIKGIEGAIARLQGSIP